MQRTLVLIKPDGVQRALIGNIISHLERRGLKIVAMKMLQMSRQLAERDYAKRRANFGVMYMDLALDTAEFTKRRLAELKVADQVAAAHPGDF